MRLRLLIILHVILISRFSIAQVEFDPMQGPPGGSISDIEILPSSGTLFALSNDKIYKSTDSGGEWSLVTSLDNESTGLLDIYVDNVHSVYVMGKNKLWKSTNGGDSWNAINTTGTFSPARKLLKNEVSGALFTINNNYALIRSTDDGLTWSTVYSTEQVNDFTIGNTGSVFIATNAGSGLLKSINNGGSWGTATTGLPGATPTHLTTNRSNGRVYVIMYATQGAYLTTNDGGAWSQVTSGSPVAFGESNGSYDIFASRTSNEIFVRSHSTVYQNVSGTGGTWVNLATNGLNTDTPSCFLASGTNYFVGLMREGMQLSNNSGASWSMGGKGINHLQAWGLMLTTPGEDLLVASGSRTIRRSNDDGNTWAPINVCASCGISTFVKLSNGNILAIGSATYLSTDQGSSFPTLKGTLTPPLQLSKAVIFDDNNIYALGDNDNANVYRTTNQGTSWSLLNITGTGLPVAANRRIDNLAVTSSNDLILSVYNKTTSALSIFKVPNGSTTATALSIAGLTQYKCADAFGSKIYVIARNVTNNNSVMVISADGGNSWSTPKPSEEVNDFTVISDEIMFGRQDEIQYSNDGGDTWHATGINTSNNSNRYLAGAALTSGNLAVVAVTNSPFYISEGTIALPLAPQNPRVIAQGSMQTVLQWDYTGSAAQFKVERKLPGEPNFTLLSDTLSSSQRYYIDAAASPETSYQYRIFAFNAAGRRNSPVVGVTTKALCATDIPDNRSWTGSIGGNINNQIVIKKHNAQVYAISDLTANFTSGDITSSIDGFFYQNCTEPYITSADDLQPNGNGTWDPVTKTIVLKWAIDLQRISSPTTPAQQITLVLNAIDPAPADPSGLRAFVATDNSIELQWTAGNFNSSFTIERATSGAFTTVTTLGPVAYPTTTFTDNGPFTPGQAYHYRVKAQNANVTPQVSGYSPATFVTFHKPFFVRSSTSVSNTTANSPTSAWGDVDNDGDDDLFVNGFEFDPSGATPSTSLFINNGAGDFQKFTNKIPAHNGAAPAWGDIDNNGQLDLIFTSFSQEGERLLYRSMPGLTFSNISTPGLNVGGGDGVSPNGWVDVDNDADLDLFVLGSGRGLFKNDGSGNFTAMAAAGNALLTDPLDYSDFAWADYDKDGDMDVLLLSGGASDPSKLFKNNGSGIFTAVSVAAFTTSLGQANTASWGDYDNDQDLDLFIGRNDDNLLFRNDGGDVFLKIADTGNSPSEAKGIGSPDTYGSSWADIDNDGDLDLLVANVGAVNNLYINQGSGNWFKAIDERLTGEVAFNAGVGFSDYDKDGKMDVIAGRFPIFSGERKPAASPLNINLLKNNTTNTNNWIGLKLIGTQSNRQAVGAKVLVTTGSTTRLRFVSTHTGFGGQNSQFIHIGLGAATTIDNIQIQWPSGITQNFTKAINQFYVISEDAAGPVITARTPAVAATAIAVSTTISLTLDEEATAVAGKKLNISLTSNPGTPVHALDVSGAVKAGNTYTFTVPAQLLPTTSYDVTIDAGAFEDVYGNDFLPITSGSWTFTTLDPPDATAPVITFTPAAALPKGFGTASPSITVTDNKQVSTVQLSIRAITGTTYATLNATAGATPNTWSVTLTEATHFDATGSEFFITATDAAGNTTRSPEGTATHKVFLTYSENESKIPSERLGFGGQKANWKVFAIPFDLGSNNAVTSIFNEFASLTNKVDYRLITYGTETAWSEYPTGFATIARGTGYFINIKEPVEITIGNSLTAPQNSRSNLFQMNLKQGWNMVGNPYLTSISWADVAAYNSLTGATAQLKKFANGQYSNNQNLSSYEGGFIFASAAATVSIPFLGQTTAGGREGLRDLDTDIDAQAWALPITLSQGEFTYSLSAVGMAPDASTSFDPHDDVTPPRFFDYLEVNFSHPEHFAKRFTRDVVLTQSTYAWSFTVDSNLPGQAHLTWDNSLLAGAQNDVFLLDIARQKLVSMKETGSYFFDPKESAGFRIYFGDKLQVAPENVFLGKAYPNPTSGLTTVAFSLPESGGSSQEVSLDIIDAMGKATGTISQGSYVPGYHEVSWDAKTFTSGFYTYRLTVNGKQGRTTQISKLIIK